MPAVIYKILIVKLSSLGDVVHALPVLRALREAYPHSHLAWVVEAQFQDLLQDHPDLNEVIVVETQKWRRHWTLSSLGAMVRVIRHIRRQRFDLVIDLQGLIKSGVVTGLSGAARRLGFHREDCREPLSAWFTNLQAPSTRAIPHVVDKNLTLLKPLGLTAGPPRFSLYPPETARRYIEDWLGQPADNGHPPLVAMHAAVGYPTKAWPTERFARLADRIVRELGAGVILTWGPGDRPRAEAIGAAMRQPYRLGPETPSLQQALALYQRLRLFISGDTGPLHLCAAMNVPTVSIYGPTDPARNGPYGSIHRVVVEPQPCSFCFKRACPTQHECMEAVSVEQVFDAVRECFQSPVGATTH